MHRDMLRLGRRRVRRSTMRNHLHFRALWDLKETGRLTVWFRMDVQGFVDLGRALGGQLSSACRQQPQVVHLLLAQEVVYVGPALHARRGAHTHGSTPDFEHLQTVTVLGGRGHLRFRPQVTAQVQGGRTGVRGAGRRFWRRRGTATSKNERGEDQSSQGPAGKTEFGGRVLYYCLEGAAAPFAG